MKVGDGLIGEDEKLYLIEEIDEANNGLLLFAVDMNGELYNTHVPTNGYGKAVQGLRAALDPDCTDYGLKVCQECEQCRSARYWDYDDYICKMCRDMVESAHG